MLAGITARHGIPGSVLVAVWAESNFGANQGHISLADMQGSWADAMGQVQFMPSTFVDFARDGDGDGRKDIWQSRWNRLLASWHRPGSPDTSGADRSRYLPDSIGASRDSIR